MHATIQSSFQHLMNYSDFFILLNSRVVQLSCDVSILDIEEASGNFFLHTANQKEQRLPW